MEFKLEPTSSTAIRSTKRPFSALALLLGVLFIAVPLIIYLVGAGYLVFTTIAFGASTILLCCLAGLVIAGLIFLIMRPAQEELPYLQILISETGVRSINGQLQLHWKNIRSLQLRHDVLSIGCRDEDDLQLQVKPSSFDSGELEAFAFACIRLAQGPNR